MKRLHSVTVTAIKERMDMAQDTLYIELEYNTEDESPVYIATNDLIGLVTEGQSFEELLDNLKDALAACLEDIDTLQAYNLVAHPRVVLQMGLPDIAPAT